MVDLEDTNVQIGIGAAALVVLALSFFGGAILFDGSDDIYYCEDRALVAKCDSLSSTSKTCYYIDDEGDKRGKRCSVDPYWIPVDNDIEVQLEPEIIEVIKEVEVIKLVEVIKFVESEESKSKQWLCSPEGCVVK